MLTSIYNFVPLNEEVFYPDWAEQASQDIPFSDGEDGIIEVTLKNVSPLFIRNGSSERNNPDPYSSHIMVDGKRLYFLPATSIKGMIRTTMEIMAFGKMTQYTNRYFNKRLGNGQKRRYSKSIADLVSGQQEVDLKRRDLVETIFGYITNDTNSIRGRVQIGNAFSDEPLDDDKLPDEVSGVLGQPKASFYPFYLKQTENPPYKTYDNAKAIAGRKLYRVHTGSTVTDLPQGNDNENALTFFKPLPEGMTFHLRIAVHNLRKMETGALLSALTLFDDSEACHNIGLAKGYGYGKLAIDNVELKGFKYSFDDYLDEFAYRMTDWLGTTWVETEQVDTLLRILSEHEDYELKPNSLEEYKEIMKDKNFDVLRE